MMDYTEKRMINDLNRISHIGSRKYWG